MGRACSPTWSNARQPTLGVPHGGGRAARGLRRRGDRTRPDAGSGRASPHRAGLGRAVRAVGAERAPARPRVLGRADRGGRGRHHGTGSPRRPAAGQRRAAAADHRGQCLEGRDLQSGLRRGEPAACRGADGLPRRPRTQPGRDAAQPGRDAAQPGRDAALPGRGAAQGRGQPQDSGSAAGAGQGPVLRLVHDHGWDQRHAGRDLLPGGERQRYRDRHDHRRRRDDRYGDHAWPDVDRWPGGPRRRPHRADRPWPGADRRRRAPERSSRDRPDPRRGPAGPGGCHCGLAGRGPWSGPVGPDRSGRGPVRPDAGGAARQHGRARRRRSRLGLGRCRHGPGDVDAARDRARPGPGPHRRPHGADGGDAGRGAGLDRHRRAGPSRAYRNAAGRHPVDDPATGDHATGRSGRDPRRRRTVRRHRRPGTGCARPQHGTACHRHSRRHRREPRDRHRRSGPGHERSRPGRSGHHLPEPGAGPRGGGGHAARRRGDDQPGPRSRRP